MSERRASEWKQNWPVALAAICGMSFSSLHIYSLGAFVLPLEREFGWSRARIASGYTVALLMLMLFAPVSGLVIDRIGPRRVAVLGSILFMVAIALLSLTEPSTLLWWGPWAIVGLTCVLIASPVWVTGVSSSFDRSRGLALAIALCGTSLSAGTAPLLATYYIAEFGWRNAYVALAVTWAAIVIPTIFICFRTPLDTGRKVLAQSTRPVATGLEVRDALRSSAFYKILVGGGAINLALIAMAVMMIPLLISSGIEAVAASEIAAMLGIASVVGRLGSGFLMDRYAGNIIAGVSCVLPLMSCALLLALPGSIPAAAVAAILFGLALGCELDATAYLATRHLGLKHFGKLFGLIVMAMALGAGLSPMAFSFVYDITGSYRLGLWILMPVSTLAAIMFFALGRRAPFQAHREAAVP